MRILSAILAPVMLAVTVASALAEPPKPDVKKLVTADVIKDLHGLASNEIVEISVKAQNDRWADMDQGKIDALDNQWKAEREAADKPLIAATLSSPLSVYLTRVQARSLGLYAEIFVMDKNGLNVGQSSITSDFWQGDEDKFQKTYAVSDEATFVDEPEWDEDTKTWRDQVSFTLLDSARRKIGAVTVELNLTELERRSAKAS